LPQNIERKKKEKKNRIHRKRAAEPEPILPDRIELSTPSPIGLVAEIT